MLSPIHSARRVRDFLTFDLEWVREGYEPDEPLDYSSGAALQLRMVGVYDGRRYRYYTSIDDFLDRELTTENRNRWFFSHFGGIADMVFILRRLFDRRDRFKVEAAFSGSSAIIVNVTRGRNCWTFVDSGRLFPMALRKIGRALGLDKGGAEGSTEIFHAPLWELAEYNYRDCLILWEAIRQFELFLLDMGGQLQATAASCALQLFRRVYLKRDIPTHDLLNRLCRDGGAYTASRVEVFGYGPVWDLNAYDINSCFPHAAMTPCPGETLRTDRTLSALCLADCTVRVPDMYLPPLPFRRRGRVYFPTGEWRSHFMGTDLQLLEEAGGQILRVHEATHFAPFDDVGDYMRDVYERRRTATDDFFKLSLKLLLNSLYGKFGEDREKTSLVFDPPSTECPHDPPHEYVDGIGFECCRMLFPGAFLRTDRIALAHEHVPISAHITSVGRASLYRHLRDASQRGRIYYSDTDCLHTSVEMPTSDALGALKLEAMVRHAEFLAPKIYAYEKTSGEVEIKAKGFRKLSYRDFMRLKQGGTIAVERMLRIREMYQKRLMSPREDVFLKRLRLVDQPKRHRLPGGDTRPWHVTELK